MLVRIVLMGQLLMICGFASAQTPKDAALINEAGNILQAGSYCDSAMKRLQQVSEAGKEMSIYYMAMAKVYECKGNKEYAEIYYGKAYKAGARGDGLLQKIVSLRDTGMSASPNDLRLENEREKLQRQNATFRKHKDANIEDFYALISMGYATMTGGKKALVVNGLDFFSASFGWPIMDDKFILDFDIAMGVIYGRNTGWYDYPAYRANPIPVGDGLGLKFGFEPSLNYILINSHRHTITAGAILGGHVFANGAWVQNRDGEVSSGGQTYFCIGPRIAYYGWKHLYISAQYLHIGLRTIRAAVDKNAELVPVSLDHWRLNVGVRFGFN
ncbi:hypothetical protein [Flavipsychrobacter stenotrophus]|nr:hypothetical protein [Flavipsychrobacter stenotrophus]